VECLPGSRDIAVGIIDTGIDYRIPISSPTCGWRVRLHGECRGRSIPCLKNSHGFNAINNTCSPFDDNGLEHT
jgi:hypothetical protein